MSSRAAAASVSRLTRAAAARFAPDNSRRRFLQGAGAVGAAGLFAPGAFAEMLTPTPRQTEGPFYPDHLPLDTDNDLLIINDKITPAVGEITYLSGRILSPAGEPVRNATVEIWQVDNNAVYIHSKDAARGGRDTNFQGFGRFLTNSKGEYYFRTIKPVRYPGRTPHIHFAVYHGGQRALTTQLYIQGEPLNQRDGIYRNVADPKLQSLLTAEFAPLQGSRISELTCNWDIVIGLTPEQS